MTTKRTDRRPTLTLKGDEFGPEFRALPMTPLVCPFGDDCDLTVAWVAGQEEARDSFRQRLEETTVQRDMARYEANELRKRADYAENRCHELLMAINEVRGLVFGANRHEERYPLMVALLKGAS